MKPHKTRKSAILHTSTGQSNAADPAGSAQDQATTAPAGSARQGPQGNARPRAGGRGGVAAARAGRSLSISPVENNLKQRGTGLFKVPRGYKKFPIIWTPANKHKVLVVASQLRSRASVMVHERRRNGFPWYYEIYYRLFPKKIRASLNPVIVDPFQTRKIIARVVDGQMAKIGTNVFMYRAFKSDGNGNYNGRHE